MAWYILVYFYRVSLAVISADVSRDLSLTPAQLGTLSGILFYVYAIAQLPLGPLIDRAGPRVVMSVCGLLTTSGGFLFAGAQTLAIAMAGRILIGIGTAAVLMSTFAIFSHWYTRKEFGRASGLMVAAGNLGNLAGTAPLAVIVGLMGWRTSFTLVAILQAVMTVLIFIKVQDHPPCQLESSTTGRHEEPLGIVAAWVVIARDASFWLLAMVAFCWYGNYLAVQGLWGGPFLMHIMGLSREETGRMLMWTSVGFIVGSMMADKVACSVFRSYSRTLLVGQVGLSLLMPGFLGWLPLLPHWAVAIYFLGIGLFVSTGVMIYPIIRASVPMTIVGTGLTSLNFFVLMGAAVAQQGMGLIIARHGGYSLQSFRLAFLFPVSALAGACLLFLFSRNYPAGS